MTSKIRSKVVRGAGRERWLTYEAWLNGSTRTLIFYRRANMMTEGLKQKLTSEQRGELLERAVKGASRKALADEYGVTRQSIASLLQRHRERGGRVAGLSPGNRLMKLTETPEDVTRRGMAMEAKGPSYTTEHVSECIGINRSSYAKMREIVLLADRKNLSEKDSTVAQEALAELNKTLRPSVAHRIIEPLAKRIWGTGAARITKRESESLKRAHADFERAIMSVTTLCESAKVVRVPNLNWDAAELALSKLNRAVKNLRYLCKQIKETQQ